MTKKKFWKQQGGCTYELTVFVIVYRKLTQDQVQPNHKMEKGCSQGDIGNCQLLRNEESFFSKTLNPKGDTFKNIWAAQLTLMGNTKDTKLGGKIGG